MNIREFKKGDIITRNEPMVYSHNGSADSSYCGDRIEFLGIDDNAKIIFLKGDMLDLFDVSYASNNWDEGWCNYPEEMYQKLSKDAKVVKPKKKAK